MLIHTKPAASFCRITFATILLVLVCSRADDKLVSNSFPSPSYQEWAKATPSLPLNRELKGAFPDRQLLPLRKYGSFQNALDAATKVARDGALANSNNWYKTPPTRQFFQLDSAYYLKSATKDPGIFQPFAQKLSLPPGSEIYFHADLHGDVHSLVANLRWLNEHSYLNGFAIQKTNFHMVFLGDFTDRGIYGVEVLYTLFRLKAENPEQVLMLRGNHEEVSLQARYGFFNEGARKYGKEFDPARIARFYDFLPAVLYLGCGADFIQCNHGGLEPGFNPRDFLDSPGTKQFQLIGELRQRQFLREHPAFNELMEPPARELASRAFKDFVPETPNSPIVLGFMWNDFTVFGDEPAFTFDPARAFVYGKSATTYLLKEGGSESHRLHAVFRGHQHSAAPNPLMRRLVASKGAFRHWQQDSDVTRSESADNLREKVDGSVERPIPPGSVWTFNVSPDSAYGIGNDYEFDTFGMLKVDEDFSNWRVRIVNVSLK